MAYLNPSITDFSNYYTRDFPYTLDPNTGIQAQDIANAYGQVNVFINPALFANQQDYNLGYLLLAAHYLVLNLRASSQGIAGRYNWLEQSKAVGNASSGFAIPQRILDNPSMAMLSQTRYGAMFLELVLPNLCGQVIIALGHTGADGPDGPYGVW